ncbi:MULTISPECIES: MAB_1171c family putative transporter, partial [unclassified Streptomyces]|uniref:MAB_1171c family putative transporter n=1 Tax=unclassified Streptomyces TaxID=2593676 RepID=UPI00364F697B
MRPLFEWLMPLLAWSVVIWRAPSAFTTRANRALWAAFTAGAIGLSTRPPRIAGFLESVTGIGDVTMLIKHLAIVAAASFLLDYVHAIHKRPGQERAARLRLILTGTAMAVLTGLFVFVLPHGHGGAYGIDAHFGHLGVQLYLGMLCAVYAAASVQATVLFWTNRRNVPPGLLRVGVTCLAAATANGALYTLYRIYFVLREGNSTILDTDGNPVPVTDPISELLPAISVVLLVLGVSVPPTRALVRYFRDQYALWRLHPLWADLVTAVPHVVLGTPTGRVRDLFTFGDRSLDVAHRAFAIRDAVLVLRDDTSAEEPETGVPTDVHDEDPAWTQARWVRLSVQRRAHNLPAPALPATLDRTTGGRTPREEVTWLLTVANAYRAMRNTGTAGSPDRRCGRGDRIPGAVRRDPLLGGGGGQCGGACGVAGDFGPVGGPLAGGVVGVLGVDASGGADGVDVHGVAGDCAGEGLEVGAAEGGPG